MASWDEGTRRSFTNDPLNLLAVESDLNRQKGASDVVDTQTQQAPESAPMPDPQPGLAGDGVGCE